MSICGKLCRHIRVNRLASAVPLTLCRSLSSNVRFNTGEKNYYTILKVTPNATQDEIKQAYYKLSKLYHPDTNQSEKAHDYFTAINEAYNVLGSLPGRRKYDRGLSVTFNPSPAAKQSNRQQQSQHFHGKRIVYDFDDWMMKHHQETMKRRKRNSAMKEQFNKRHVTNEMDIFNRNVIIAAVFTLIGLVVLVNGKKVHF